MTAWLVFSTHWVGRHNDVAFAPKDCQSDSQTVKVARYKDSRNSGCRSSLPFIFHDHASFDLSSHDNFWLDALCQRLRVGCAAEAGVTFRKRWFVCHKVNNTIPALVLQACSTAFGSCDNPIRDTAVNIGVPAPAAAAEQRLSCALAPVASALARQRSTALASYRALPGPCRQHRAEHPSASALPRLLPPSGSWRATRTSPRGTEEAALVINIVDGWHAPTIHYYAQSVLQQRIVLGVGVSL